MSNEILVIFLLLLLNAFFALSEMAIVSSSKPLLREFAKQGKKSAAVALQLSENSGRFLSTVQVGITLVGIFAGAYGGATIAEHLKDFFNSIPFLAPHGESVSVFIVVSVITYFSVVIGELVPKQLALNNSERFAMAVARPMLIISKICTPVVALLEISAQGLMALLHIKHVDEGVTEMEIKAVIADGVASGAIEDEEHDMIRRVIRLGDRDVKSIMTHRTDVDFVDVDYKLSDIRNLIEEGGHSYYPVIDKDRTNVLGVVKTRKILSEGKPDNLFKIKDYMSEITFINENTPCLMAFEMFQKKRIHMIAVVDEYGSFEGLFTASDLLEAIVGMIPSNYDDDEDTFIVRRDDGSWLVDGLTPIDEIHMTIGIEEIEADADYQTIAGFVLDKLQVDPAPGRKFEFANHEFEVLDMDGRRIDKILISSIAK